MAVGSIPNTAGIGLEEAGVQMTESGHIQVNRVARTSVPNIYAAGDCTTFVPLASVASMQGRTAVFHALGRRRHPAGAPPHRLEHLHRARDRDGGLAGEGHQGADSSTAWCTSCRWRRTRARR